jgi:predicted nucleic acid-binding protein
MTVRVFVDTNVLVYARDASEPVKQQRAAAWMEHLWRSGTGRLSVQVLQEFYVTVTEKLRPGLDRDDARGDVRSLLAWSPLPVDSLVIEGAWAVQDRYRISWWDGLIVAAAQIADCRYLLSEDLQPDQLFGDVRIIDPFDRTPASLGLT